MSVISKPTVTVGMPVYNGAGTIEKALAALEAQTFCDFRLLISDNVSSDGTWEILQKWAKKDDRIVLYRQQTNVGAMRNFQYVLDRAETEYFLAHACDDWLAPNYLEELVPVLDAEPECALVCPETVVVEPNGLPARKASFPPPTGATRLGRVRHLLAQPQATRIYGLFRSEALRKAQVLAQEFGQVWSVDHLQLLDLALNDQIRGTDRTCFYFRRGSPSGARYRPTTLSQRLCFAGRYVRFHLRLLVCSRLTLGEKILIAPWLLVHAVRSQYTHPLRRFVKRPIKRLFEMVILGPIRAFR